MTSVMSPCGKYISNHYSLEDHKLIYTEFTVYQKFIVESSELKTEDYITGQCPFIVELRERMLDIGYSNKHFRCDYWPMGGGCMLQPGACIVVTEDKEARKFYGKYTPCSVSIGGINVDSGSLVIITEPLKLSTVGATTIIYP